MITIQQSIVEEHINDLRRDAEALRAERILHGADREPEVDVGGRTPVSALGGRRPVRVRLGLWLIGLGNAVAGGRVDGASRRAA